MRRTKCQYLGMEAASVKTFPIKDAYTLVLLSNPMHVSISSPLRLLLPALSDSARSAGRRQTEGQKEKTRDRHEEQGRHERRSGATVFEASRHQKTSTTNEKKDDSHVICLSIYTRSNSSTHAGPFYVCIPTYICCSQRLRMHVHLQRYTYLYLWNPPPDVPHTHLRVDKYRQIYMQL